MSGGQDVERGHQHHRVFSQLYDIVRQINKDDAWREDKGLLVRNAVERLSAEDVLFAAGCTTARGGALRLRSSGERLSITASGDAQPHAQPVIQYTHLFENEHVSAGIFCLPKGSCIPLHDHPGMTVVSRVLCGALHVRSYDWVGEGCDQGRRGERERQVEAVRVFDGVVRDGPHPRHATSVLFPRSNGNMHRFEAVEDCAVLDVIYPPYDSGAGRGCTYYRVDGDLGDVGDGRVMLKVDSAEDPVRITTVGDVSHLTGRVPGASG